MAQKVIPIEVIIDLHESLMQFPPYSRKRRKIILKTADENNVSEWTVRRQYYKWINISKRERCDKGVARIASSEEIREWMTMIGAVKFKMLNESGKPCSTRRAITILEKGVFIENKKFQLPIKKLKVSTTNRWLKNLGIHIERKLDKPPTSCKKSKYSNSLWQISLSPSNARYFKYQIQNTDNRPYFLSVTDIYSGVIYAEYRFINRRDAKAIIKFIYDSMAPKKNSEQFPFHGVSESINFQFDKIIESPLLYKIVERKLGCRININCIFSQNNPLTSKYRCKDSYIKLQEDFEKLLESNEPGSVKNINERLYNYLIVYNSATNSTTPPQRSPIQTWKTGIPETGCRSVCDPHVFKSYFTEQEHCLVNLNSQLIIENRLLYSVDSDLAGKCVEVFQTADNTGIFVKDIYGKIYGPYRCNLKPEVIDEYNLNNSAGCEKLNEKIQFLSQNMIIQSEP